MKEYGQQLGHAQACERRAESIVEVAAVTHIYNVEELHQQVHVAHVRERHATVTVEATNADMQFALAVAGADAARAKYAIRSLLSMEWAHNLEVRDRTYEPCHSSPRRSSRGSDAGRTVRQIHER